MLQQNFYDFNKFFVCWIVDQVEKRVEREREKERAKDHVVNYFA